MTPHLYVLSIGPVQDFIAAARRTRDLWFGSYLLSEISKAAAREIAESGGKLIFPALEMGDENLEPPAEGEELEAFNVANVILAELPEDRDPANVNTEAQKAARKKWVSFAEGAKKKAGDIVRDDIWEDQVDDVIEFNAAWVPLPENGYKGSRRRLMRLLAGRKSLRNFQQVTEKQGIPKSSLDGARETVLNENRTPYGHLALQMRLSNSEQLCAVGLTKRLAGGRTIPFPSVTRVALDPWIRKIKAEDGDALRELTTIGELCRGVNTYASGTGGTLYQDFPYDGQVCYPSRLAEVTDELRTVQVNAGRNDLDNLKKIKGHLQKLLNMVGEPNPYLAVLVADGDHMGRAIADLESAEKHHLFSKKLSEFASEARETVQNADFRGVCVYTGGDDVLAFLPVDTCLDAARKLHETFGKYGEGLTLSVGIAIGHKNDSLEDLLNYGRAAEEAAKDFDRRAKKPHDPIPGTERNGLAVHLHTRSGGNPLKIREQWKKEGTNGMDKRLKEWISMHLNDDLPDKAAYELLVMAKEYQEWSDPIPGELLKSDARRLFKRKKAGHGTRDVTEKNITKLMDGIDSPEILLKRAKELVITRRIASVTNEELMEYE